MHDVISQVVLRRRGLLFLPQPSGRPGSSREFQAVLLELAALGYAASARLRGALELLSTEQLARVRDHAISVLAAQLGADQTHRPLFRKFPDDIPRDTTTLWFRRVLVHYIQGPDQPCLFCAGEGSTHVLRPCEHVVCDRCFDGSNDSACPICNRQVDRGSPFFGPDDVREQPNEAVRFKRLELGENLDAAAQRLFEDFCARTQALNPVDSADFKVLVAACGARVLQWLPEAIPLRENVALVFGQLLSSADAAQVLPHARRYLKTATDVLRLIASTSGADPSLQGSTIYEQLEVPYAELPWFENWSRTVPVSVVAQYRNSVTRITKPKVVKRFRMAKLGRATRRALLAILDELDETALLEDMLRHRSYWVWVGEFLHPGEYATRYPKVARAFEVVRKRNPDGVRAERFRGFYAQLEQAATAGDSRTMLALLARRPGELARRFDHLLRIAGSDHRAVEEVVAGFVERVGALSTSVLLTLYALLPTRVERAKLRMFWPKGSVSKGVTMPDRRPKLSSSIVAATRTPIELELLQRFGALDHFATALIDDDLRNIVAPFNERTASPAAVNLPRGSKVAIGPGKLMRMFLHWCEREGGQTTDIDLSVGFYDKDWRYLAVCSYYALQCVMNGDTIAKSSGDLTSAPPPDGSSEFVDVDRESARKHKVRYAVMVVNAYGGDPFDRLERGFAGLMLRDDPKGHYFDPRTVALKFSLQGSNGVYMPMVVDLESDTLHWLDVYSTGQLAMNNVASSNQAITRICPETIAYFESGGRLDMRALARLHAAARCQRVLVRRAGGTVIHERRADESASQFHARLAAEPGRTCQLEAEIGEQALLGLLHRGDLDVPAGSSVYALFRERISPTLEAADLIRGPS